MKLLQKQPLMLCAALALMVWAAPVSAEPKPTYWSWWPEHWLELDWQPYLEGAKHPHNSQWNDKNWTPAMWAEQEAGGMPELIRGFYDAEILNRQYMDDEMPVLSVGPNFYHLSGYDKRRIARIVDEYYQITTSQENGMFVLEDWRSRKPIGTYTVHGLQLQ